MPAALVRLCRAYERLLVSMSDEASSLPARAATELTRLTRQTLTSGLYLVATPIGNLGDITLRALSTLSRADVIYCEDTRHSRTLLAHFGITSTLKPYHEHNAEAERPRILAQIENGQAIALISDAGTPLVSDPGYKLVRDCIAAGFAVDCIPGASAVLSGLSLAGLPTNSFFFAGFLPPKSAARKERIRDLLSIPATLIVFEAPQRVAETLRDLADILGARQAVVARELTKLHQDVQRAVLTDLADQFAHQETKGEIVILVGPPEQGEVSDELISAKLSAALQAMKLKDAAKAVADALGVPKSRVYDIGLALKAGRDQT